MHIGRIDRGFAVTDNLSQRGSNIPSGAVPPKAEPTDIA
jgi:hypothetical protein